MKPLSISCPVARSIVLNAQLLSGGLPETGDPVDSAQAAIERLGYVQLDTISVIERAHHHVIRTREPQYRPADLAELQERRRSIFEYWTHAAALIPMTDFRYYLPRMKAYARRADFRDWLTGQSGLCREVLGRIESEGPLGVSDFPSPGGPRGPWWDWSPVKRTLETLFWTGRLMIAGRRKFQRLYDLTDRVIPANVDRRPPSAHELTRFIVDRVLRAHGIVTVRDAAWWLRDSVRIERELNRRVRRGEVVPVRIETLSDGEIWYGLREAVEASVESIVWDDRVRLLSPFDNAIIDRKRTLKLFDFDYKLECYTPPSKRKFGYFTLPILWEGKLVGRVDTKAERRSGTFRVISVAFEDGFAPGSEFRRAFGEAVEGLAVFNGCTSIDTAHAIG